MDLSTLIPIVITVIIHVIGIGIFLVWFAAGRPMSKQQFQRWWKDVQFLPAWVRNRKPERLTR
jgi:L-asparagine transporter-like permease